MAPDGIPYGSDRSWLAEKILSRLEPVLFLPQQQAGPTAGAGTPAAPGAGAGTDAPAPGAG